MKTTPKLILQVFNGVEIRTAGRPYHPFCYQILEVVFNKTQSVGAWSLSLVSVVPDCEAMGFPLVAEFRLEISVLSLPQIMTNPDATFLCPLHLFNTLCLQYFPCYSGVYLHISHQRIFITGSQNHCLNKLMLTFRHLRRARPVKVYNSFPGVLVDFFWFFHNVMWTFFHEGVS